MTPVDPHAVEAAARAEYEHTEHDTWDQAHPQDRADWLESARVALEAAQGIMWAQALRDEADKWERTFPPGRMDVRDFPRLMRDRADELDPQ